MTSPSADLGPTGGRRTRVVRALSRVSHGGLTDVPMVARIFSEARCFGAEFAKLARVQGRLLTHAAYEAGAFWVQHDSDGSSIRAAAAIPTDSGALPRPVLSVILRSFEGPSLGGNRLAPVQDELLGAIDATQPTWIVCQGTPKGHRPPDNDLLITAVEWASRQDAATLAVLAHSPMEQRQAEDLGFVEHRGAQPQTSWWLGLRTTYPQAEV